MGARLIGIPLISIQVLIFYVQGEECDSAPLTCHSQRSGRKLLYLHPSYYKLLAPLLLFDVHVRIEIGFHTPFYSSAYKQATCV